ncbi:MAG: DNA-binding protein [Candidatus Methanoliparum thermophilum]|uniref:DNA-binding protein EF806_00570 n=1 Tax=Methanoliparum thermophilum TaxID=2491083 RepID=A0A520KTQ0_METT2|nr:DNA-binding protein [Candidatus Methanoliparum sp. LAM-1]RZN65420.1 MAG: DNA-binding protein [Candidatus Methanoliparum thermophilum]BDC35491.1 hypothetical protein MTLP_01730 [Candidatus Methanoliparum sp. LAM-1]
MIDDELDQIKRKRLEEMISSQQNNIIQKEREEEARREYETKKREILRQIMTIEARDRLNNLRLTKPDIVEVLENQLISLASSGRLRSVITDEQLKLLLKQIQPKKKDFKIKRI